MKTALIMEGGAMRGMFTCGVIDVLMKHGLSFDGAAGISAGAVFGCNFKSRQIGRPIRYNKRYCADPRYCSIRSLLKTGDLYGADFCYRELPDVLDLFDRRSFREFIPPDVRKTIARPRIPKASTESPLMIPPFRAVRTVLPTVPQRRARLATRKLA